jgi:hypothetical protein
VVLFEKLDDPLELSVDQLKHPSYSLEQFDHVQRRLTLVKHATIIAWGPIRNKMTDRD